MRLLSANSRLSLAVLLEVFCQVQALGLSRYDGVTHRSWNNIDGDSDLMQEIAVFVPPQKILRLVVKYNKSVND